ncbi:hypothetical protein Cantr_08121 [Candida viswanathii]|uniref:C2H2-type domain-containing protein n=1 Tax=Candida viswanathii TaxID=5486 RepID=A0A367Y774_9ASCO|nr:hypothetical protein Cantr_08121 [Candida viswanathii]
MTASTQFNYGRRNSNVGPYTIPTSTKTHHGGHHGHHELQSPILSTYQLHHHHHSYTPTTNTNTNTSRTTTTTTTTNTNTNGQQAISSPPLSASVPTLSREFVVRRISEGETGRLKEELRCEACGKGYKHISSLAKHLWEHTPEWNVTKKLLISKHQQVQLLEAASILVGMNEQGATNGTSGTNGNGNGGSVGTQHQMAVQRHMNQQHRSRVGSLNDHHQQQQLGGNVLYSPPASNTSTPPVLNSDPVLEKQEGESNQGMQFKNGYDHRYRNDDEEEEEEDDEYDAQRSYGRMRSVSHEPPRYDHHHEVTSPILQSEQTHNPHHHPQGSGLKSPSSSSTTYNVMMNTKGELPVKTNFAMMNGNKNEQETYSEEGVIGTMEA